MDLARRPVEASHQLTSVEGHRITDFIDEHIRVTLVVTNAFVPLDELDGGPQPERVPPQRRHE